MNEFRIVSAFSPQIELGLYTDPSNTDLFQCINKTISFFKNLQNSSIFVLPREFKSTFSTNPRLRIIKDAILSDSQCNILFANKKFRTVCTTTDIDNLFSDFEYAIHSKEIIVDTLYKNRIPFLVGITDHYIDKNDCNECGGHAPCCNQIRLLSYSPPDFNQLVVVIESTIKASITHWRVRRDSFSETDLKLLMVLMCVMHKVTDDVISIVKNIRLSDYFLSDIKSLDFDNLCTAVFALFRACAYPSSTGSVDRHPLSIDWHRNDPYKYKDYCLVRVDIVPPNKSGIGSSGRERALLAKKDDSLTFMYYTYKHDFCNKTIETRLDRL